MAKDKWEAMDQIRALARQHNLAVSVITVDDVLNLKGVETEPTTDEVAAVTSSWEWKHYGDNWSDWFEGFMLEDSIGHE